MLQVVVAMRSYSAVKRSLSGRVLGSMLVSWSHDPASLPLLNSSLVFNILNTFIEAFFVEKEKHKPPC